MTLEFSAVLLLLYDEGGVPRPLSYITKMNRTIYSLLLLTFLTKTSVALFGFQTNSKRVFISTPVSKSPKRIVADCMTVAPLTLEPSNSVDEAMSMLFNYGISGCPVVDANLKLVGVVSSYDFLQQEAFEGALLPMEGSVENVNKYVEAAKKICGQKVEDVMSSVLTTVTPETPMRRAAALMTEHKLHHLPVVDQKGVLVGVLTSTDVMRDLLHVVKNLPEARSEPDASAAEGRSKLSA